MVAPLHKSGKVITVNALGPCAKRLGQRGPAVTQVRQRDLAVTALVVFLRVCCPFTARSHRQALQISQYVPLLPFLVYILNAAGPGYVLRPLSNNAHF